MKNVSRIEAANFAVAVLGHTKASVAAAFNTSPRTLGRWMERVQKSREERMSELTKEMDAKYEGKVSRRRVYTFTPERNRLAA